MASRRKFFLVAGALHAAPPAESAVIVPVQLIVDDRVKFSARQIADFWSRVWGEAVSDLAGCKVRILGTRGKGEIRRSPSGAPVFVGLLPRVLNLVITGLVPTQWDNGRGLSGVTTRYEGFHLCVISLHHAHGHRIPFFSVNTCLHELLHALMLDIFEKRPGGLDGEAREFRIDRYATRLWLFGDGAAIRRSAEVYVRRLQT